MVRCRAEDPREIIPESRYRCVFMETHDSSTKVCRASKGKTQALQKAMVRGRPANTCTEDVCSTCRVLGR